MDGKELVEQTLDQIPQATRHLEELKAMVAKYEKEFPTWHASPPGGHSSCLCAAEADV